MTGPKIEQNYNVWGEVVIKSLENLLNSKMNPVESVESCRW